MWFADIGLAMALIILAGWSTVVGLATASAQWGRPALGALLTPPARLPVLVGTGAAAVLFAAQAGVVDTVADLAGNGVLDQAVWAWFVAHRTPSLTVVMAAVSRYGGTAGMALLALIGAAVLWRYRRRAQAGVVVAATVGAALLVSAFKNLYGRVRPPLVDQLVVETNAALPSGHSLGSVVVLGVLAAVVVLLVRRTALRVGAVLAAAAGIAAIGVSRLYLGVHWATDVLTGWLLGGAWLALCVTALVLLGHRARPDSTPAGTSTSRPTPASGRREGGGAGAAVASAGR